MRARHRRIWASCWLAVAAGSLLAPACRVRYEDLEQKSEVEGGGPSGDAGASTGGSDATGGAVDDAGAPSSGGSLVTSGGTPNGGTSGNGGSSGTATAAGEGGGPTAPPCASTADCTCDELGGHSYWFCTRHLYWTDANAHCQTVGMSLVRLDSSTENDFVLTAGTTHGVFAFNNFAQIGASDQAVAGEWRWPDGTLFWEGGSSGTLVPGFYANWDAQSPSANGNQACSGMLSSGLWQDRTCTGAEPFVCESP